MKLHLAQTVADLMLERGSVPSTSMFTGAEQPADAKDAAFTLLRLSGTVGHEPVCNACLRVSEARDDDASAAAASYLAATVALKSAGNDRLPAIKVLKGVLGDPYGLLKMKITILDTFQQLFEDTASSPSGDLNSDAVIDTILWCLLDPADSIRQRGIRIIRGLIAGDLAGPARRRMADQLLQWLVNDTERRLAVIVAIGEVRSTNPVITEVLTALLNNADSDVRLATLRTLSQLGVSSASAIATAQRFLHASDVKLRDACSEFVFHAVSLAARRAEALECSAAVVTAAAWCLREGSNTRVREAALLMLRDVAMIAIESVDDGIKYAADEHQLKDCLQVYLDLRAGADDVAVQRVALNFWVECFAMEPDDVHFLKQLFDKADEGNGGTTQCDLRAVAQTLQSVVLRTEEDAEAVLGAVAAAPYLLPYFMNPLIRYSQLPGRAIPEVWEQVYSKLKIANPILTSLLAAEFIAPSENSSSILDELRSKSRADRAIERHGQLPTPTSIETASANTANHYSQSRAQVDFNASPAVASTHSLSDVESDDASGSPAVMTVNEHSMASPKHVDELDSPVSFGVPSTTTLPHMHRARGPASRRRPGRKVSLAMLRDQRDPPLGRSRGDGSDVLGLDGLGRVESSAHSTFSKAETETASVADKEPSSNEGAPATTGEIGGNFRGAVSKDYSRSKLLAKALSRRRQIPAGYGGIVGAAVLVPRKRMPQMPGSSNLQKLVRLKRIYSGILKVALRAFGMRLYAMQHAPLRSAATGTSPFDSALAVFEQLQAVVGVETRLMGDVGSEPGEFLKTAHQLAATYASNRELYRVAYERFWDIHYRFVTDRTMVAPGSYADELQAVYAEGHSEALRNAREVLGSAAPEQLPTSVDEWLKAPLQHCELVVALFRELQVAFAQHNPRNSTMESAFGAIAELHQKLADAGARASASASLVGPEQVKEYGRLCEKKFKSSCPQLYLSSRYLIGRWKLRQVKTRKTGFLARFTSEPKTDESGVSTSADHLTSFDQAGTECKIYLFNDALMVTRKKAGSRMCKRFVLLIDVELIESDGAFGVFGLKMPPSPDAGSDGKAGCQVFKGGASTDSADG